MTHYIQAGTKLPSYLPFPRFLLERSLTQTAKLLYAVLLDRATLSQANGWMDEAGQIYIIFPIAKLAGALCRSAMTVKNALTELEAAGLVERRRQSFAQPNRIYVKVPEDREAPAAAEVRKPVPQKKTDPGGTGDGPSEGKLPVQTPDRELSPNHLREKNLRGSNRRGAGERARTLGRYQNVRLTGEEAAALRAEFPGLWEEYVERLSAYMASTGRTYRSHAATIRRWAQEDARRGGGGMADYTCGEGESL